MMLPGHSVLYPDHTYTFLFCDLMTDEVLAELPVRDVAYGWELNGIGALRGTIPFNGDTLPLDPLTATAPGRTCVYVDRDGVILWGGIIWTRELAPGGRAIQAAEFLSYYQRRYLTQTLSTDTSLLPPGAAYVPTGPRLYRDQVNMVWALLRWCGIEPSSIWVDINPLVPASGVNRDRTYYGHERPEIYKLIKDLSEVENGFDFGQEVGWTATGNNQPMTRYRRVRAWYPRRGRRAAASGLVFTKGGPGASILDYSWPEDGTALATRQFAVGEGEGDAALQSSATATDLLDAGWPLLEHVEKHDGVVRQGTLDEHAAAGLAARRQATVQPWFEVSADTDPQLGTYQVGDYARFIVEPEPRMPAGLDVELRIVSAEVTARRGPERVRLTCVGV